MGLYKRGKVWWISYTVTGRLQRKSTGKTNKKDAGEVETRLRASLLDGTYVPERRRRSVLDCPPFEIAAASYLGHQIQQGKRESSYGSLRLEDGETSPGVWVMVFRGRPLDDITSEEIETRLREWQDKHGWSNATRNNRLNQLSGLFSYAYGRRWIDQHPTEKGRVPRLHVDNARERWLRSRELEEVIGKCADYLKPIVRFAASTGMRLGEVCGLTRASVERDDQDRAFVVTYETKNRRPLFWPLEAELLTLVEVQLRRPGFPGGPLFPGPGSGNARSSVRRHFRKAVEAAGLEWGHGRDGVTFHSLRHTFASLAASNGIPFEVIQRMGNWKDPRMVARYAKFSDEAFREAAAKLARITSGRTRAQVPDGAGPGQQGVAEARV